MDANPRNDLNIFAFQGTRQLGDGLFQGSQPLRGRVDLASGSECGPFRIFGLCLTCLAKFGWVKQ